MNVTVAFAVERDLAKKGKLYHNGQEILSIYGEPGNWRLKKATHITPSITNEQVIQWEPETAIAPSKFQVISGNILEIKTGIIGHQVNCKGVMNAGLAESLRSKYPVIFPRYREFCESGFFKPGMVQFIKVGTDLYVCNLAGQDGYGRDRCYTDYDAVATALTKLYYVGQERSLPIYLPYKMGCGLGGGDWAVICELIDKWCPSAIVVRLP